MVSSIQIDSMLGLSQWDNLLATMPSRTKIIFPPPFESQSFLNRGNWYPSILNWLSEKLVSSLVLSMQSISILDVEIVRNKAKGRISKRVFQESKARQNFRKTNISYPQIRTRTCAYQEVGNVCFFGNFGMLCFLETPVLRFTLLPYYRRNVIP